MAKGSRHLIIRTSWLFGIYKTNFVEKILEGAQTRDRLESVTDPEIVPHLDSRPRASNLGIGGDRCERHFAFGRKRRMFEARDGKVHCREVAASH